MARCGILLNVCVALVWATTRFVGYPSLLGFARLPVEPINVAATVAEVTLVVLLVGIERGRRRLGPPGAKLTRRGSG